MPNTAHATWTGTLKEGSGRMELGQGAFAGAYTFKSRFEGTEEGTNPEELIAAAHAACISMAASGELVRAGIEPESVQTTAEVRLRLVDGAQTIHTIILEQTVTAPGADEAAVRAAAEAAKAGCPVSRALAAVPEIRLELTVNT